MTKNIKLKQFSSDQFKMIHHVRIRLYVGGETSTEKYSYNISEGQERRFSSTFQPWVEGESLCYTLVIQETRTLITFHEFDSQWNGKPAAGETFEIHKGHVLSSLGVTIEILDCPEQSKKSDREVTTFIDLKAFDLERQKAASTNASRKTAASMDDKSNEIPALSPFFEANKEANFEKFSEDMAEPWMEVETGEFDLGSTDSHNSDRSKISPIYFKESPAPLLKKIEQGREHKKSGFPLDSITAAKPVYESYDYKEKTRAKSKSIHDDQLNFRVDAEPRSQNLKRTISTAVIGLGLIFVTNQLAKTYLLFDLNNDDELSVPVVTRIHNRAPKKIMEIPRSIVPISGDNYAQTPDSNERGLASNTPVSEGAKRESAPSTMTPVRASAESLGASEKASIISKEKSLMIAIEEGNITEVARIVGEDGPRSDFTLDEAGRSPFVRAAAAGRLSILQFLISKRSSTASVDYKGNNALMWATINGHEKTVSYLVNLGFNLDSKRVDGKSALDLSRAYHQREIERLLLSANRGKGGFTSRIPASNK